VLGIQNALRFNSLLLRLICLNKCKIQRVFYIRGEIARDVRRWIAQRRSPKTRRFGANRLPYGALPNRIKMTSKWKCVCWPLHSTTMLVLALCDMINQDGDIICFRNRCQHAWLEPWPLLSVAASSAATVLIAGRWHPGDQSVSASAADAQSSIVCRPSS
jgi:hypothetical protein